MISIGYGEETLMTSNADGVFFFFFFGIMETSMIACAHEILTLHRLGFFLELFINYLEFMKI